MGRSLKYDIPGVDPRVPLSDIAEKGWTAVFAPAPTGTSTFRPEEHPEGLEETPRRVLEIGFGRGEFLLAMAAQQPHTQFVGIEVAWKRTLKMARKVARAKLDNVRLLDARAEHAIQVLFEPGSLDAIWLNFSDPWPKVRHAHRRVVRPGFVGDAAVALKSSGTLFVATDDVPYAHQIDEVLSSEPRLQNVYAPFPLFPEVAGRMRTGYEAQWRAAGRPLHFFAYGPRTRGESGRVRTGGSR